MYERAIERWGKLDVTLDTFSAFVHARIPAGDPNDGAIDLYLTCACTVGDAKAVARFEQEFFGTARDAIRRIAPEHAVVDEALQLLRVRLFVGSGKEPGIGGYAGRGSLAGWVRIAATRIALTLLRGRRADGNEQELERFIAPQPDPELELNKRRYGAEANAALREAFGLLTARERNLLRQHFVDGLGIDQLGKLYGVHRATTARWLDKARRSLERATRQLLKQRLGDIGVSTVDSILQMVQSELHLSLATYRSKQ